MQDQAILEERQRFTRDIHDGIGGQLVSLLLRARRGKLGKNEMIQEIQSGINDLRLIVDSMDHVGDDLSSALVSSKQGSPVSWKRLRFRSIGNNLQTSIFALKPRAVFLIFTVLSKRLSPIWFGIPAQKMRKLLLCKITR